MKRVILICIVLVSCGSDGLSLDGELAYRVLFPIWDEGDIALRIERIELISSSTSDTATDILKLSDSWNNIGILDSIEAGHFVSAARNFEYSPISCTFEQSQQFLHAFLFLNDSEKVGHMDLRFCTNNDERFVAISYLSPSGDLDYVFSSQVLQFVEK